MQAPLFFENMKIWVLSDGKAGHQNQSVGVAEALCVSPKQIKVIKLEKRKCGSFFSFFWPPFKVSNLPSAPWPDVVIATGNLTVPVSKWIKMQNPSTVTVQMMAPLNRFGLKFKPGGFLDHAFNSENLNFFDVVASPVHENQPQSEQTVVTIGAPNLITPLKLKEGKLKWSKTFQHLGEKKLAVLVGGSNKRYRFNEKQAAELAMQVKSFAKDNGYSLMVTTSRRTGEKQTAILRAAFKSENTYFFDGEGENPYFGFLACADRIVVTCDSVSMVSEACSTGKTVYLHGLGDDLQDKSMGKFNRFYKVLKDQGYIYSLNDKSAKPPVHPLNDTAKVAGFIKSHLIKRINVSS
ncbi:MAG: mitochondrial fission protein ELM1 [Alphaproteobacteria bacterium]|jgi:mitochondrial fission protein ELM1